MVVSFQCAKQNMVAEQNLSFSFNTNNQLVLATATRVGK